MKARSARTALLAAVLAVLGQADIIPTATPVAAVNPAPLAALEASDPTHMLALVPGARTTSPWELLAQAAHR